MRAEAIVVVGHGNPDGKIYIVDEVVSEPREGGDWGEHRTTYRAARSAVVVRIALGSTTGSANKSGQGSSAPRLDTLIIPDAGGPT